MLKAPKLFYLPQIKNLFKIFCNTAQLESTGNMLMNINLKDVAEDYQQQREKCRNKWDYLKLQHFCNKKRYNKNRNANFTHGGKIMCQSRDYPKYVRN